MKKNRIWHLLAFCIPFLASMGICMGIGIYPFGENCILHVDMYHQYCPYFTEFLNKLQSGGSLQYTWHQGLGADFVGMYAYYLASPFNWLLVFCPKEYVIEFMTLLTWVKIGLCGFTFFFYLKEHFSLVGKDGKLHENTALPALVFAVAYALSGYVAAYSWDIMWMDGVLLAPLVILGLERLVKDNRPALYYISLSTAILSNYYISIMICIFCALYFGVLFVGQKNGRGKALGRFTVFSLLAGSTGAVLLLPELKLLSYTGASGEQFPQQMKWYFNLIQELSRGCTAASPYTGSGYWPNIYAGAFCLLLLVLFFFNRRIRWQDKLAGALGVAFFLVSFANNYLDFIWHGFHFPNSLPARQSFLYIFMVLVIGFAVVRKWKGIRLWHMAVAVVLWGAVLVAAGFMTDEDVTEPLAYVVTGLFLLCYALLFVLIKLTGKEKRRILGRVLALVALAEVVINMAVTGFYSTSRTLYRQKMEDYEELISIAEEGELFCRIEDSGRKTKNDNALYGYASVTEFSSLMNMNVSHFYQSLYMEGGKNYYCYNGAIPLTSAMLSVKYTLSDSPLEESAYRRLVAQSGEQYLYENTYCLPLGFMMDEDAIAAWDSTDSSRRSSLNSLAQALGATGELLAAADCVQNAQPGETDFSIQQDGYYYAAYINCGQDTLKGILSGGRSRTYAKTTHRYLLELGYCSAGDELSITNSGNETISFYVYRLNEEAMEQAYETLSSQTMELTSFSDTQVEGQIDVEQEGRLILSIPDEAGWTLYVDGEETPTEPFADALIAVHLEEGYHTIRLCYQTPYLAVGAAISLGSVLCFGILMLLPKMRKKKKEMRKYKC
jgi:uncharacterized membrane protein YfhO